MEVVKLHVKLYLVTGNFGKPRVKVDKLNL